MYVDRTSANLVRSRSLTEVILTEKEGPGMMERLAPLLLLLTYIALMKWVLPRFGVPT
jgi:hypothetical protein